MANERLVNDLTKKHNDEVMRIHEENQNYVNKIIQQHQDKLNNNNEQVSSLLLLQHWSLSTKNLKHF